MSPGLGDPTLPAQGPRSLRDTTLFTGQARENIRFQMTQPCTRPGRKVTSDQPSLWQLRSHRKGTTSGHQTRYCAQTTRGRALPPPSPVQEPHVCRRKLLEASPSPSPACGSGAAPHGPGPEPALLAVSSDLVSGNRDTLMGWGPAASRACLEPPWGLRSDFRSREDQPHGEERRP